MSAEATPAPRQWDPIVKLTHWGIVAAVIGNALFTEEGSGWHVWVGYGLAALLGLRLLWGLIGPAEARFSAFPPSPRRALTHLGEIRRGEVVAHTSHNPLGALMVYAIWACLGVIIATGIAMSGPPPADPNTSREHEARQEQPAGAVPTPDAEEAEEDEEGERQERLEAREEGGEVDEDEEEGPLGEIHEVAVNFLYLLIALHLAGVIFETRRSGPHIARAMIPGGTRKT